MRPPRRWATRTLLCMAVASMIALPRPAFASPPHAPALKTWGAGGAVKAEVILGDVLYFGGAFTTVISPDGSTTLPRRHLAAVDVTTGDLLPWAPATNGSVEALVTDGTNLIVGGSFTTINGISRSRLGAVDVTGNVLPWTTGANDSVLALAVSGPTIYVGGKFTQLGGASRDHLGAVGLDGSLQDWTASTDDRAKAITTTASGDVIVGRHFTHVNGEDQDHIARLDATTGQTLPWDYPSSAEVVGLVTGPDDNAYGAIAGPGGKVRSWSNAGVLRWTTFADGDVNAITYFGGQVIAGGHWVYLNDGSTFVPRLAALDPSDGTVDLSWVPKPNKQVWSFATDGTSLAVGGVFTTVSRGTYRRVAIFR